MAPPAMATAETGELGAAWLGTIMAVNARYKCTRAKGNHEACSWWLAARPNTQADEARHCVTTGGAGQGNATAQR